MQEYELCSDYQIEIDKKKDGPEAPGAHAPVLGIIIPAPGPGQVAEA